MAQKQIEMEVKTADGYDALHPKTDADIVSYDNSGGYSTNTNVQDVLDELFTKGGVKVQSTAPAGNATILWVDTGNDGLAKYWNGTEWTPIKATGVWGS